MCRLFFVFLGGLALVHPQKPPNFIFLLTDDQDLLLDGLIPMEKTVNLIANDGITFTNAFVNSPICCPSRSTILTGKYPHNTLVTNNSVSGHCSSRMWQLEHEPRTVSSLLKSHGYTTFYAGKYLNQYGEKEVGGLEHVPVGYDWWIGLKGNSKYQNFELSVNGTTKVFHKEYLTDLIGNYALSFLEEKPKNRQFFMFLAPPAAHAPFTPAPRHRQMFPAARAKRTPSFNFTPIAKHWLLQIPPANLPSDVQILDDIQRHRLQTLVSVDEMVEALVNKLKESGEFEDTYFIFASDNGFHIGQFGQPWDKRQPYETDIRIPLLIRGPKIPKKTISTYPASAVDLAPTILDLAGIRVPDEMDGTSFKNILQHPEGVGERVVFLEYYGEGNEATVDADCPWKGDENIAECVKENWCKCQDSRNNTYWCFRRISPTFDQKFCKFFQNPDFFEFYNLRDDRYELENLAGTLKGNDLNVYQRYLEEFAKCRGSVCRRKALGII